MKRYSLFLISLILLMTTGCNQRKEVAENPFFEEWETPYGVPPFDRIRPEHFLPAFQRAMSIQEAEIDAIKSNGDQPSFENVILAYDRSGLMLEQVGLVFNMLCSADVNDQLLAAKEQAMPLLAAHRDNILLDEVLFDKIKAVYDRRGSLGLDAVQTRLVEKIYGKFVRAGALLDPQQKERLRQINGELALLPVKFGNNVLRATNDFMLKLTEKQARRAACKACRGWPGRSCGVGIERCVGRYARRSQPDSVSHVFYSARLAGAVVQSIYRPLQRRQRVR
ncbi:MAG: hypothetical protein ACLURY_11040 [Alistipes putredinis]